MSVIIVIYFFIFVFLGFQGALPKPFDFSVGAAFKKNEQNTTAVAPHPEATIRNRAPQGKKVMT